MKNSERPPAVLRRLSNGMPLILVPCEAESIAFGLFVSSGSRHETARTAGISHFIEHMLFKGTPTRTPLAISQAIEGRGGNFNACTSEEGTCYYAHLPSEYAEEAVDILSDMYLHASIPDDEFVREKQVVIEEIRMYADEPDAVAMENLQRALFPKNRLGASVAGSAKSLGPLTPQDLRDYIASHYLPSNTLAVAVGAFDEDALYAAVDSRLGRPRRGSRRVTFRPVDFAVPTVPEVEARKDVNQCQLALGYRMFGVQDERKYAATLMDAVLGRGMSSRLFQEVREKRGLSYDISSRLQLFTDAGMFTVTAGVDPAKAEKALATVDRELAKVVRHEVGKAELARTKEFLLGNFRLSMEKVVTKMFFYGNAYMSFGRLVAPAQQVAAVAKVTAKEIRTAAAAIFAPENRSVSRVLPARHD